MKAVLCPVCNGSGKIVPLCNTYGTSTGVPQLATCHGCGGMGWVQIEEYTRDLKKGIK